MVITQSLLKVIKNRNPSEEIDVIAPDWSKPLLDLMPEAHDAIPMPAEHGQLALGLRWNIGRGLRKKNYDRAIVIPRSYKSAIVPFVARAKRRTGFLGELRWGLLNDIRRLEQKSVYRIVDRFISLALDPGENMPKTIPEPSFQIQENHAISISRRLGEEVSKAPTLGICPGAEYGPAKRWPEKYFSTVANKKIDEGWKVWLFGSSKDAVITKKIQAMTQDRCLDLAGRCSLNESIHMMSLTSAVVTNDSGLMHVAAALGKYTIAIFGSTDPLHTPPLSQKTKVLYLGLPCSPCFKRECPLKHLKCLKDLSPEQALNSLQNIE
jgi:heptosyltransferase-2